MTPTESPDFPQYHQARYDLLAVDLVIAVISALLLAAVGSSVKVVQLLEKAEIAGIKVNLAVGAVVNPGVLVAAVAIFCALVSALCCVAHNRLAGYVLMSRLMSFLSWAFVTVAFVFFAATLIFAPLSLAVQVGLN